MNPRCYLLLPAVFLLSCGEKNKEEESTAGGGPRSSRSSSAPATLEEKREANRNRRKDLKRATGLPTTEERNREISKMVWDSLELDPELAMEGFSKLMPGSEEKNRLVEHLAMRMAEKDPDEAAKWASALETDEEKSLAYGSIAVVLAEKEPERAATMLSNHLVDGREGSVAVTKVVQRWAVQSPQSAADWVLQFKPGEAREAGIKAALSSWSVEDSKPSVQWISDLPTPALQKEAIRIYAEVYLDQPKIIPDPDVSEEPPTVDPKLEQIKEEIRREAEKLDRRREEERAADALAE